MRPVDSHGSPPAVLCRMCGGSGQIWYPNSNTYNEGYLPCPRCRTPRLEAERDRLRAALEAIRGPADSGPFIDAYRAAGGGYEGLQAIAREALGEHQ